MICISILNQTYERCRQLMASAEMAELRLDLLSLTSEQRHMLISISGIPVIATCREGKHSLQERLTLLKQAIDSGASYVDVELNTDTAYREELADYAKVKGCKLIISHHDNERTPQPETLLTIIDACRACNADIVKLVTAAQSTNDVARILSLYQTQDRLVAFAMGELGRISRLACLFLGAPFSYASAEEGKEAAAGQMAAENMARCIELMKR